MSTWAQVLILLFSLGVSNIVAARARSATRHQTVATPEMYGLIEPVLVKAFYWLSLRTLNQAFRLNPKIHAKYIDFYTATFTGLAFLSASLAWGQSLWVLAIWRISCILVQILSVGILRNKIRAMRGDGPPPSDSRIVVLGLMNWAELIALFALLYQTIRGGGIWLYESFTTQATMSHSVPFNATEKIVVVAQMSMSILLLTTLIGLYVGTVNTTKPKEAQ